ncbi:MULTISPECIES: YqaA family protein [unclassified Leptospira]|uniref:YqaA family protein n=1 Tax=unclassified Leptospira TaxID=2633828 RepID=UPI0002BDD4E4|nr:MULTISPECIES: VTT domain-containing protein [unclassified Leptospira]EMJ99430.1 SNARE-like domain protein [Leptospira sp. B5-022]MCR1792504.1 VTT domain-containing protein [Leptospira sp. id769339]
MELSKFLSGLLQAYAGPGLSLVSFGAATLLPFSSEAALMGAIWSGFSPAEAVFWASIGNCAACAFNYSLGYWFGKKIEDRISRSKTYAGWAERMSRWGYWALGFSFLPFIGDPITVLSGFFRQKFWIFALVVFSLRILRYITLAYGFGL